MICMYWNAHPACILGPEEISSLLIYATLSASPRSDTIARTAFEMTRGYLKVRFYAVEI